ncbi:NTTRR-F1 domain [Fredinandcohnia quinoae]|uniref:NTTRR-F1 domain n=1 Tax=Fredinandcohnia quinoae TaxID=2918902 RepID=A0AAW5ED22_9BACI|nr:NTTRR-F1 domain [Fredinandcohnia sp. SECRCQ15]MCH1627610.1 NTTRR-F1 domain [Fredinandcohnia sp. SECRCQ15]
MSLNDLIINGDFETGSLSPWIVFNAIPTISFSHSGIYSALLPGGDLNSFIAQFVPATPGQSFGIIVSLAKIGTSLHHL